MSEDTNLLLEKQRGGGVGCSFYFFLPFPDHQSYMVYAVVRPVTKVLTKQTNLHLVKCSDWPADFFIADF